MYQLNYVSPQTLLTKSKKIKGDRKKGGEKKGPVEKNPKKRALY